MELRGDGDGDPFEHAFESQSFQAERHGVAAAVGQARSMNPDPHIAQQQRDGHEHQPQMRCAGTGIDTRLPQLPVAGFDTESLAIAFADVDRTAVDAPGGEQQLLGDLLAVFAVFVTPIADAHCHRDLLVAILHDVRIPAGRLPLDPLQAAQRATFLGLAPRNITGIKNGKPRA